MKKVQAVQGDDPMKNMFANQNADNLPPGMADLLKSLGDMGGPSPQQS